MDKLTGLINLVLNSHGLGKWFWVNIMDEEKWNKTRTSGKYRYVMNEGLRWGLISGSLWAILSYFIGTSSSLFTTLLVGIVVFSLAGCLWAIVSWLINERKYHRGRSLE